MHSALWVSKTGMAAQDTKMTAISNNLANVNTVGFKRDRVVFEDLFYSIQRQPGAQVDQVNQLPTGVQLGSGVRVVGTQKVFTQAVHRTLGKSWILRLWDKASSRLKTLTVKSCIPETASFMSTLRA